MDCLAVLLDPATKAFAKWLLEDDNLLEATTSLLKEKHLKAYKAVKSKGNDNEVVGSDGQPGNSAAEEVVVGNDSDSDEDSDDEEVEDEDDPVIMLDVDESIDSDNDLTEEANAVFDKWMKFTPNFSDYLFDGAEKLKTNKSGKVTFKELISKFDTMKYHRESCSSEFPSVNILAKVHFSSMLNAGFQERVFLTCGFVQGTNQGQIAIDHMDMKDLLMQNADLICEGVI